MGQFCGLRGVQPIRIELAQKPELSLRRELCLADMITMRELKSRVVLHLPERDPRMQRDHIHALALVVEAENAEIGHHPVHATSRKTAVAACRAAAQETRAGNEIDF